MTDLTPIFTPDEEAKIAKLAAKAAEPRQVTLVTVEDFLSQAQEPELAAKIDAMIETIQVTTGADDRKMLRSCFLLMRSIALSMPWDEDSGLDARRFHLASKSALPSWRQCIGACLQLEFFKPDGPVEVEVEKGIVAKVLERIEAEEVAEAETATDESDD